MTLDLKTLKDILDSIPEVADCPWCVNTGSVRMACTDMGRNSGFQVWCSDCWAHGPSRPNLIDAAKAWNTVARQVSPDDSVQDLDEVEVVRAAIELATRTGCSQCREGNKPTKGLSLRDVQYWSHVYEKPADETYREETHVAQCGCPAYLHDLLDHDDETLMDLVKQR